MGSEARDIYGVVYRFTLNEDVPDADTAFIATWSEMTEEIRETRGGLGSRLHREGDGVYFAYAEWPSRAVLDASRGAVDTGNMAVLRERMQRVVKSVERLAEGETIADLSAR